MTLFLFSLFILSISALPSFYLPSLHPSSSADLAQLYLPSLHSGLSVPQALSLVTRRLSTDYGANRRAQARSREDTNEGRPTGLDLRSGKNSSRTGQEEDEILLESWAHQERYVTR
ncbi:hypothetical protein VNI00_003715 [Paramarasmius palmivorus]|uniref:Uncharacterized protein n=1 Tax=Paramarasmius palmivorus TaxID=297713 RepID=A0AAW0DP32_9AGAR